MKKIIEVMRRLFKPAPRMSNEDRLKHLALTYHDAGLRAKAEESVDLQRVADARWRQLVTLCREMRPTESAWAIYRSIIEEEQA